MTTQLKSIGIRPGSFASYNTMSLLKFFAGFVLIVLIITWIAFELFDYVPGTAKIETFQPEPTDPDIYYKPIPRPANNIQHIDANLMGQTYDADILRANRYYNTTDGLNREIPVTNLLSLTNEMPTTYMMSVLEKIKSEDSTFSFPITPGVQKFIDYYTNSPNDLTKKPTNMILSNLDKLTPTDLQEIAEFAELFTICRLWLITKINMAILDNKMADPNHPFAQFQIINSRNTKILITNPEGVITDGLTLICDMIIHRPYKTHTFNIQATVNIKPGTNNNRNSNNNSNSNNNQTECICTIKDIRLIGSTIAGEVHVPDGITPVAFNGVNVTSAPVSARSPASSVIPNAVDIAIGDYSAGSVGIEKNMAEYLRRQEFNNANKCGAIDVRNRLYESARVGESIGPHAVSGSVPSIIDETAKRYLELNCGGKCFGVDPNTNAVIELFAYDNDKIACESTHNELAGQVGVYDYPCKEDADCPYWQANKNYPNTFGKCIKATGVCEMPEGIIRMGFKKEHKESRAKCNNCNILPGYEVNTLTDESCCIEQQNKLTELGINSPDYRFSGDFDVRRQPENASALENMGLLP